MADERLSELAVSSPMLGADVALADLIYIVDVSATTAGSKSITVAEFFKQPTIAMTGAVSIGTINGTITAAPTATANQAFMYVADAGGAGTATMHVLTEDNKTVKLMQGAAITDALTAGSATAADCAAQLNLILARLRANGLIAT